MLIIGGSDPFIVASTYTSLQRSGRGFAETLCVCGTRHRPASATL